MDVTRGGNKKDRKKLMITLVSVIILLILLLFLVFGVFLRQDWYSGKISAPVADMPPPAAELCRELLGVDANGDGIPDYQQADEIKPKSGYDETVLTHLKWVQENIQNISPDGIYREEEKPSVAEPGTGIEEIPHPAFVHGEEPEKGVGEAAHIDKPKPAVEPEAQPKTESGPISAPAEEPPVSEPTASSPDDGRIWIPARPSQPPVIRGIYIQKAPEKTEYIEDQVFDPTGMKVRVRMSNGTSWEAKAYQFDDGKLAPGAEKIEIRVLDGKNIYTAEQPVTVTKKVLLDISAKPASPEAVKVEYVENQVLDPEDWSVTGRFNNGLFYVMKDVSMDEEPLKVGTTEAVIRAEYRGVKKETTVPISVRKKKIAELVIATRPEKTEYIEDTEFKPDGIKVLVKYDNGVDSKEITEIDVPDPILKSGQTEVTVRFTEDGVTIETPVPIQVADKKMVSAEITKMPDKTEYIEGEPFLPDGLEVLIHFDNGKSEAATNFGVPDDFEAAYGDTKITLDIPFREQTERPEIPITVKRATPVSLEIRKAPDKTAYIEEEVFLPEGMLVEAGFDNGKQVPVSKYQYPEKALEMGDGTVRISYEYNAVTVTTDVAVSVAARIPLKLAVDQPIAKTSYINGEKYNREGLQCSVLFNNGKTHPVDAALEKDTAEMGDEKLTVSYTENGVTVREKIPVSVRQETLLSAKITQMPDKTAYVEGTKFDPSGIVVTRTFDNGLSQTTAEVAFDETYEFKLGDTSFQISVTDFGVTKELVIPVTVRKKSPAALEILQSQRKTEYLEETVFDNSGLIAKVNYDNGSAYYVYDVDFDESELRFGQKEVEISYTENGVTVSAAAKVTVIHRTPVSAALDTPPAKTAYINKNTFDGTGVKLAVAFDNGKTHVLDAVDWNPSVLATGQKNEPVSYTENGKTITVNVPITVRKELPVSMTVKSHPYQESYYNEEAFAVGSPVFSIVYDNGEVKEKAFGAGFTCDKTGMGQLAVGVTSIGFTYTEDGKAVSASVPVRVIKVVPVSLAIKSNPTKTSYINGQKFQTAGLVFLCTLNDGRTFNVQPGETSYSTADLATGQKSVNFQYTSRAVSVSCGVPVSVVPEKPASVKVKTNPRTSYVEGMALDLSSLVLTVQFDNGKSEDVRYNTAGVSLSIAHGARLSYGTSTLTAGYTRNGTAKQIAIGLTVVKKAPSEIKIIAAPTKTSYIVNETLNLSGLRVQVTYNDGATAELAYNGAGISCSPAHGAKLQAGNTTITISYTLNGVSKQTTQAITVINQVPCTACGGDGYTVCSSCDGEGWETWYDFQCDTCGCGGGTSQGSSSYPCWSADCDGTQVVVSSRDESCDYCSGGSRTCSVCNGTGMVTPRNLSRMANLGSEGLQSFNKKTASRQEFVFGNEGGAATTSDSVVIPVNISYSLPDGETDLKHAAFIVEFSDGSKQTFKGISEEIVFGWTDGNLVIVFRREGYWVSRQYPVRAWPAK